ncbi:MAG: SDR family NAD(P)-dependent oxidoreductase [Spirochaetales bacterium]|nr:SDR family NAD(P)-dependent oxidoreductase [Spirochaetales bacterium]
MKFNVLKGQKVWITGASSGIGLELAILAAEAGAHLHLFSSRKDSLAEAARICVAKGASSVHYTAVDVADSLATEKAAKEALQGGGTPQYLLLNAGISQRSLTAETDFSVTRRIMDVNFFGAVMMTRVVLPSMIEAGGGHIAATSSIVGLFGFPLRSAYSASKHALHGYFETIALEYAHKNIQTTLAVPGRIKTPIGMRSLKGDGQVYGKTDPGQAQGMDARLCAKRYWKAVLQGKWQIVIGGSETIIVFFRRWIPPLFRRIARKVKPT